MSKVISICGEPVAAPGTPNAEIVALLERHLADAKAGKTVACGVVSVDCNGWVLTGSAFPSHRFSLIGAISALQYEINVLVYESRK